MATKSITAKGAQSSPAAGKGQRSYRPWTVLIAIAAIGLAAFLLFRTLRQYSLDQLLASVATIPVERLLSASGFAAASYLCLTGFDYLALQYAGRPLPYRKAALASFSSLSLGHNIGLAFLSSGAIRYRFYTRWGLNTGQVAKVILFCGLTVGLGLMLLAGAAFVTSSELVHELTGLPRSITLALGAICLVVPCAYLALASFVRTQLTIRGWSLEMPPLRLALGQVVLGPLNFACVAGCLHQALAAAADVSYLGVASVYVIANTTAILSHVPGGLGVIESVVLYLLPKADVIGPLLVFRFVYFLAPLVLGGILLAITEGVFRRTSGRRDWMDNILNQRASDARSRVM